ASPFLLSADGVGGDGHRRAAEIRNRRERGGPCRPRGVRRRERDFLLVRTADRSVGTAAEQDLSWGTRRGTRDLCARCGACRRRDGRARRDGAARRTGGTRCAGVALGTLRPDSALRSGCAGVALVALGSRVALRAGLALRARGAGVALWSGCPVRSLGSRVALRAGGALRSRGAGVALVTLRSGWTDRSLGSRVARRADRAL